MNKEILRKLQLTELKILKDVVEVFEKENLSYFLIGGTLLGAVRHKGFIPWDDDIDIAMPREDYQKFLRIHKTHLDEKYFLHCHKTDSKYWLAFAKVRLKNTIFDEAGIVGKEEDKGISIDIFPLDNANKQESRMQRLQAFLSKGLIAMILWRRGTITIADQPLAIHLVFYSFRIFSIKFLHKIMHFIMSWNRNNDSEYNTSLTSHLDYIKLTMLKSKYYPEKLVEFEGIMFKAPNDCDYVLKRLYGNNYMELPPEQERTTHNPVRIEFGDY